MSDPPLRIAVTSYYLPSGSKIGAGWMAHRLANAMVDRGHRVTMFSPCPRPDDARYDHVVVPVTGAGRTLRWAAALRRLDLRGFDVLHAHGDDHLVRRGAVPVHVRTLHGSCFDEARFVPGAKEKLRMLYLGLTEAVSAVRTPVVVGVSRNSIRMYPWLHEVIPNTVDTTVFRPPGSGERDPNPTILFVGTDANRKRGRLLRRVFATEVRPRVPGAQLWMVCSDAPAETGVHVLGRLTDDELADRYRRAWVFCLPSTFEGFGVPYVEALVSGLPVVATPNRGAREVLEDGAAGLLVPDEQLGATLVRLLTDPDERARWEAAGVVRRARYDHRAAVDAYERLYRAALTGRGAARG